MNYLNDPNTLNTILSYVCSKIMYCSDVKSLMLVNSQFNTLVPKHIIRLIKLIQSDIEVDQLKQYIRLKDTIGLSLILESSNDVSKLPKTYRRGSLSVFYLTTLAYLMERKFKYIKINYFLSDQVIHITVRNNYWYVHQSKVHELDELTEVESSTTIVPYDSFTPEYYKQVCDEPDFDHRICVLDSEVCQLLNIPRGPHQYGNIEIALYNFCQAHPPSRLTCKQRIVMMKNFTFLRDDQLPIIQRTMVGDLIIEDVSNFIRQERQLTHQLTNI